MTYLLWSLLLPVLCILAERLWPDRPGQPLRRRGLGGDLLWYLCQGITYRFVAPFFVALALSPVLVLTLTDLETFLAGFGPLSRWPLWRQAALALVVGDFFAYWQHRVFHREGLWPIHAVHHSSEALDWLSATRFHPFNEIGAQLMYVTPVLLCGFDPRALAVLAPVATTAALVVHMNVPWSFGPLRYVIASPRYHRFHHSQPETGGASNYGAIFAFWDLLFGTFYMPRGERPRDFGLRSPFPDGFVRQLRYPLEEPSPATQDAPGGQRQS